MQALSKRSQELERLKSEWSGHSASLTSQHSASLNAERERALQAQTQAQARFEQERRELEQAHLDRVSRFVLFVFSRQLAVQPNSP